MCACVSVHTLYIYICIYIYRYTFVRIYVQVTEWTPFLEAFRTTVGKHRGWKLQEPPGSLLTSPFGEYRIGWNPPASYIGLPWWCMHTHVYIYLVLWCYTLCVYIIWYPMSYVYKNALKISCSSIFVEITFLPGVSITSSQVGLELMAEVRYVHEFNSRFQYFHF